MSGPWKDIERKLADAIGLDPEAVGANLIPRAVKLRMIELGLSDVRAYAALLGRSDAELETLIEEVVIPESWFFRDEVPFRLLQDHVRDRWIGAPARGPLRVLSIPCAAGEEPYSIAIALLEAGLAAERFTVHGVDVSARRLDQARRGVYSANAFRGDVARFRDRYFRRTAQGFALEPAIRDRVAFFRANILDPALLEGEPRYDVLFCRNLLIYLKDAYRAGALAAIDRLLARDGLLFIGHADRLGPREGEPRFIPEGDPGAFAYRRAAERAPREPARARTLPSPASPPVPAPAPARQEPRPLVAVPAALSPPTPAKPSDPGGSLLEQAAALANQGLTGKAIAACERSIRQEGPTGAAYHLLGMIYRSLGNLARGDECFSRAVYLDPDHDEALLALALSAERRGDTAAAAGFRRRAERAALKKGVR
jgi:chemotaxis protein methyltransferase WspC